MQTSDFEGFLTQLALLFAGYDRPITEARKQAYFAGLAKMTLVQFARVVEFALGPDGPDDLPTTRVIWRIHWDLRRPGASVAAPRAEEPDHLLFFADRLFLRHLLTRGGLGSTGRFVPGYGLVDCVGSPELLAARSALRDVVDWFAGPVREGDPDATPREFVTALITAIGRVSRLDPTLVERWERLAAQPESAISFAPALGRELDPKYDRKPRVAA